MIEPEQTIERDGELRRAVVYKVIEISIDCGCWKHSVPRRVDLIISTDGIYLRATDAHHVFHRSEVVGPITIRIEGEYFP